MNLKGLEHLLSEGLQILHNGQNALDVSSGRSLQENLRKLKESRRVTQNLQATLLLVIPISLKGSTDRKATSKERRKGNRKIDGSAPLQKKRRPPL